MECYRCIEQHIHKGIPSHPRRISHIVILNDVYITIGGFRCIISFSFCPAKKCRWTHMRQGHRTDTSASHERVVVTRARAHHTLHPLRSTHADLAASRACERQARIPGLPVREPRSRGTVLRQVGVTY